MRDTILLVENDDALRETIRDFLCLFHWRVLEAADLDAGSRALQMPREVERIALVICAEHLRGGWGRNGCDLFSMRSLDLMLHGIPFLLLTSSQNTRFLEMVVEYGMHLVQMPFGYHTTLLSRMHELIQDWPEPPTSSGNER